MKKRMFAILLTAAMVMTSLSGCKSADSGDSKKRWLRKKVHYLIPGAETGRK